MTVAAMTIPSPAQDDQRPSLPQTQANTWLRLLLTMTMPTLFLLIGYSLIR